MSKKNFLVQKNIFPPKKQQNHSSNIASKVKIPNDKPRRGDAPSP